MKEVAIIFMMTILLNFLTVYAQATDVLIGMGGSQGVYYPAGINICGIVNSVPEYGIDFSAVTTEGSIFNINSAPYRSCCTHS